MEPGSERSWVCTTPKDGKRMATWVGQPPPPVPGRCSGGLHLWEHPLQMGTSTFLTRPLSCLVF